MSRFSDTVRQYLTHALSLSERVVRALFAVAVGASTLLTETLFPEALRETTTYQITLGLMQQYIIEQVAEMEREIIEGQIEVGDDFAQRKMVGTALEAAGLLTMHFSPLWVFAIAGDAAGGSKVYLNRLVENLKENNLVAKETKVTELVGLLEAVQQAAALSATIIDMPPLSSDELSAMADEMWANYGQAFVRTVDLMPQLDDIWQGMEQLTSQENISMEQLFGLMTVDAVSNVQKGAGIVLAAGQTGIDLFNEDILDSFRRTLTTASVQGVDAYVQDHMQPFLQTARSHFDSSKTTWIERKLGGSTTSSESDLSS